MKLDLLLDVVRVLETVPEENFDLAVWRLKVNDCKTIGCAIGHYCNQNPDIELKCLKIHGYTHISFNNILDFDAVAKYFDLAIEDASFLFQAVEYKGMISLKPFGGIEDHGDGASYHSSSTTKSEVIGRILKFVEDNAPKPEEQKTQSTAETKELVEANLR